MAVTADMRTQHNHSWQLCSLLLIWCSQWLYMLQSDPWVKSRNKKKKSCFLNTRNQFIIRFYGFIKKQGNSLFFHLNRNHKYHFVAGTLKSAGVVPVKIKLLFWQAWRHWLWFYCPWVFPFRGVCLFSSLETARSRLQGVTVDMRTHSWQLCSH